MKSVIMNCEHPLVTQAVVARNPFLGGELFVSDYQLMRHPEISELLRIAARQYLETHPGHCIVERRDPDGLHISVRKETRE